MKNTVQSALKDRVKNDTIAKQEEIDKRKR
jgi:hypothetical protein